MTELTTAPSEQTDFDPNQAVTVVEDVNNLLLKENMPDSELITGIQNILPNFTNELTEDFLKANPLQRIEIMNVLAQDHQKKVLLDNKINYISTLLPEGNTINNTGLDFNISDLRLQDDLSRSKQFSTRKKKFNEKYPNGVYTTMSLPLYDDETVEIFKKNKNDSNWNFRLPYGRDAGELGVVSGNLFNLRTATDIGAAFIFKGVGFRSMAGLTAADYVGQQADKTLEQALGYGEREYSGELDAGTLTNYFTNIMSNDMKEAGIVGGTSVLMNRGINWFTKGDRSLFGLFGTSDKAKDFTTAFEQLKKQGYDVDPLVYAQISGWPILRSTFFQAKDFVTEPKNILDQQALSLYNSFKKFGIDLGGDVIEGSSKINHSQLTKIKQDFELEMGDLLKAPLNDVDGFAANSKFLNFFKKWDETATAQESILKNTANNMSKIEGINYNLSPIKTEAKKIIKELNIFGKRKTPTKSEIKKAAEEGFIIPKTVKLDQPASPELIKLLDNIGKLETTIFRAGGGNKAWSEATDQIFALRKKALELTTHSDKNVRDAGIRLYNKIKKQYSKPQGGTDEFNQAWNTYIQQVDANDLIRQTKSMKEALNKGELDASDFVSTYLRPELPDTTSLVSKMVSKDQADNIKDAFIIDLSSEGLDNFSSKLNSWLQKNPEGLVNLLGEETVRELNSMAILVDKFNTGLISKSLKQIDDFSAESFVNFITRESSKNNLGSETVVKNLIEDLGGFNSKALDEIRSGIISNILKKSRDVSSKNVDIVGDTLDPGKFYKEIAKIEEGPLSQFFDAKHLETIKNFDLYTKAITNAGDVGGPMAAGGLRGEIAELPTKPTNVIKVAKHLLGYKFISYILGKKQNAAMLEEIGGNVFTEKGIFAIRNALSSQLGDTIAEGSFDIDSDNIGQILEVAPSEDTPKNPTEAIEKKVIESEIKSLPGSETQQTKDANRNPVNVSRLSQPNMAPPIGAGAGPKINTMAGGPSTMNRGQQLFGNNPREITFAAKGGIMNTMKATQRVL